jgi:hypothetical protein
LTSRPRILYLVPRYPWPLDRGDRIRGWGLTREFGAIADVTLVALSESDPTDVDLGPLPDWCERVEVLPHSALLARANMVAALPGRLPFQVAYYRNASLDALMARLSRERFDLVFGQMFRVFPFLEKFGTVPRIVDLGDSLAMNLRRAVEQKRGIRRLAFRMERDRVDRYEATVLRSTHECWVVGEADRTDLLERVPDAAIEIVPNGVLDHWGPVGGTAAMNDVVLLLGNLTVGHNLDMVRFLLGDIFPRLRERRPTAELWLVGKVHPDLEAHRGTPGVTLHGYVENLAPLLARARVAVTPLRYGAGIQNKVLETMAAGLPNVVTPMVNESIGAVPDRELLVAGTAEELAGALARLLDDPALARAIGAAGRERILRSYSWRTARERMEAVLESLPGRGDAG